MRVRLLTEALFKATFGGKRREYLGVAREYLGGAREYLGGAVRLSPRVISSENWRQTCASYFRRSLSAEKVLMRFATVLSFRLVMHLDQGAFACV